MPLTSSTLPPLIGLLYLSFWDLLWDISVPALALAAFSGLFSGFVFLFFFAREGLVEWDLAVAGFSQRTFLLISKGEGGTERA